MLIDMRPSEQPSSQDVECGNGFAQLLRERDRAVESGIREQRDELFAAVSRDQVGRALDGRAKGPQRRAAGRGRRP